MDCFLSCKISTPVALLNAGLQPASLSLPPSLSSISSLSSFDDFVNVDSSDYCTKGILRTNSSYSVVPDSSGVFSSNPNAVATAVVPYNNNNTAAAVDCGSSLVVTPPTFSLTTPAVDAAAVSAVAGAGAAGAGAGQSLTGKTVKIPSYKQNPQLNDSFIQMFNFNRTLKDSIKAFFTQGNKIEELTYKRDNGDAGLRESYQAGIEKLAKPFRLCVAKLRDNFKWAEALVRETEMLFTLEVDRWEDPKRLLSPDLRAKQSECVEVAEKVEAKLKAVLHSYRDILTNMDSNSAPAFHKLKSLISDYMKKAMALKAAIRVLIDNSETVHRMQENYMHEKELARAETLNRIKQLEYSIGLKQPYGNANVLRQMDYINTLSRLNPYLNGYRQNDFLNGYRQNDFLNGYRQNDFIKGLRQLEFMKLQRQNEYFNLVNGLGPLDLGDRVKPYDYVSGRFQPYRSRSAYAFPSQYTSVGSSYGAQFWTRSGNGFRPNNFL